MFWSALWHATQGQTAAVGKSVILVGYIQLHSVGYIQLVYIQFKERKQLNSDMTKLIFRSLSQVYVNLLILNSEEGKHTNKLYQIQSYLICHED